MKTILLSLAAVAALGAAAAPAAAQPWRDYGRYDGYQNPGRAPYRLTTPYVDSLEWKITNAAQEGRISWGEARDLRSQFRQVQPIAWRVQTGEASPWETARLDRVVTRIEQSVDGRRYGYARGYRDYREYSDRDDYGWRR